MAGCRIENCHGGPKDYIYRVSMSLDEIVEEARQWPAAKLEELVDRLTQELHPINPTIDLAWKKEARRRLAEIENGTAKLVDGELVISRLRKTVRR